MSRQRINLCLMLSAALLVACTGLKDVKVVADGGKAFAVPAAYHGSYPLVTDIIHTKLDLSFNWDSAFVIGKAQIEARPYFRPANELVLNAKGFRVGGVSLIQKDASPDGQTQRPLNFTYDGRLLKIQLDKTYQRSEKYIVSITYTAMPNKLKIGRDIPSADSRGIYFVNPTGKDKETPRQIWTQGESEYNCSWFPTINGPQEKMTQEISITVPEKMKTLSNGDLDFSNNNGDGTRTDVWRQDKPHSTYLAMIAVGDFVVTRDKWRDIEVNYLMEPAFASNARLIFGKTPAMMEFFSDRTGVEYPWAKYSQIVVREYVSGAMENTTATVFFDRMNMDEGQYLDENYEEVVAHELFHHWFGDLVTCESWANLPLNESFATYGEYLWNEHAYGRDHADYFGMKDLNTYLGNPANAAKKVIRYNYGKQDEMFDNVTYEKGGRIVHMLRKTVGDDAFFKAIAIYLKRFAYKTVEINDLRMVFEEVTGEDLNWFFNQWFLASGHPRLTIHSNFDAASKQVEVTIRQTQDITQTPLYRIPLAIDIYTDGKPLRKQVVLDQQEQHFTFAVNAAPKLVNVDAEKYVLCEKTESKPLTQYIFQYHHAPLFMDRFEAVSAFIANKKEREARREMIRALADKSWYLRKLAVDFTGELDSQERLMVYPTLKKMVLNDPRSYVRAAAIVALRKFYNDSDNEAVFKEAAKDKAPSVIKALSDR